MGTDRKNKLFWLHIKKSAGQSTRRMLSPMYVEVERVKRPACFIQSRTEEYNDVLNNFRVVLGDYQFRRCLFAKKYLYHDKFEDYLRLAFSRNPLDRCMSQFFYLWNGSKANTNSKTIRVLSKKLKFRAQKSYDFDRFLDAILECRSSNSNYSPYGLHFQTHVAAMWPDITDDHEKSLLDLIYRLEDLTTGINHVREALGHSPLNPDDVVRTNTTKRPDFEPSKCQVSKVADLFSKDFDIYEGMCERVGA